MRICIASEHYPSQGDNGVLCIGGAEATAYRIAREMATRHEIHVVCSREPGQARVEAMDGHTVYRVGPEIPYAQFGDKRRRIQFVAAARREIARRPADVVLNFALLTAWPAASGAAALGCPSVWFITDVWQGRWRGFVGPVVGPVAERVERWLIEGPWTRFAAYSEPIAELLAAAGVARERVIVIPPVVEVEAARAAEPLDVSGTPVLCHVGRLVEYKGAHTVIRATAILAEKFPEIRLIIVGDGPERSAFERLASDLGIAERVAFLGKGPNETFAWQAMAAADVFCLASTVEGFGIVVPEAMATGTPVVCSDIPVLRWVTGNGRFASLFRVGDPEALAAAVELALVDTERTEAQSERALDWADQFSGARICDRIEELLATVRGQSPSAMAGSRGSAT